jgi:hypothetical protein
MAGVEVVSKRVDFSGVLTKASLALLVTVSGWSQLGEAKDGDEGSKLNCGDLWNWEGANLGVDMSTASPRSGFTK